MTKFSFIWGKPQICEEEWCAIPDDYFPIRDFDDAIGRAVEIADEDSWFVDGYPGCSCSGEFHVKNNETGEIVRFEVHTEFQPSFWWSR